MHGQPDGSWSPARANLYGWHLNTHEFSGYVDGDGRLGSSHAQEEPLSHTAVTFRGSRTVSSCSKVYVTVLSGDSGQDDPAGRRRLGQ